MISKNGPWRKVIDIIPFSRNGGQNKHNVGHSHKCPFCSDQQLVQFCNVHRSPALKGFSKVVFYLIAAQTWMHCIDDPSIAFDHTHTHVRLTQLQKSGCAWPPGNWVKHLINNAVVPTFLLHHFLVSTIEYKNNGRHCLFCELDIAGPNTGNKTSYLTNNNQYIKLRWFLKYVNLFLSLVWTWGLRGWCWYCLSCRM